MWTSPTSGWGPASTRYWNGCAENEIMELIQTSVRLCFSVGSWQLAVHAGFARANCCGCGGPRCIHFWIFCGGCVLIQFLPLKTRWQRPWRRRRSSSMSFCRALCVDLKWGMLIRFCSTRGVEIWWNALGPHHFPCYPSHLYILRP
jgi:hypothetical protein